MLFGVSLQKQLNSTMPNKIRHARSQRPGNMVGRRKLCEAWYGTSVCIETTDSRKCHVKEKRELLCVSTVNPHLTGLNRPPPRRACHHATQHLWYYKDRW